MMNDIDNEKNQDHIRIKTDPEFKSLLPKLSDKVYKGLEASILKEGCRVWMLTLCSVT